MTYRRAWGVFAAGICAVGGVVDAQVVSAGAEMARIQSERKQVEERSARDEAACYQRFAVNDCLLEVRAQRRTVLLDLRRQEISLTEAERKARGAAQVLRADERMAVQSDAAERALSPVPQRAIGHAAAVQPADARSAEAAPGSGGSRVLRSRVPVTRTVPPRKVQTDRVRAEVRFAQKQREAAERRAKRDARNASRKIPVSPPLPPAG